MRGWLLGLAGVLTFVVAACVLAIATWLEEPLTPWEPR